MKDPVRKIVAIASSCVILFCLYVIAQEGFSLGMFLTIISQCFLIVGAFADPVIASLKNKR